MSEVGLISIATPPDKADLHLVPTEKEAAEIQAYWAGNAEFDAAERARGQMIENMEAAVKQAREILLTQFSPEDRADYYPAIPNFLGALDAGDILTALVLLSRVKPLKPEHATALMAIQALFVE